jgi:hypothetical protein
MVDWEKLFDTVGTVARGMSDAAIINNWLQLDDQGAYQSIVTQVMSSPVSDVDRLDGALLLHASGNFSQETRERLVKFYVIFKMAEMQRFQQFRGLP